MASFNFPNSPALNDTYSPVGGPVFTWDGVAWKGTSQGAPVTVYVSDTAPLSPAIGQLWWNSATGTMAIWYADADSAQWVQVGGAGTSMTVVTVLTTSGTYTKPAGLRQLEVILVGAGGGSWNSGTTAAGQTAASGGGGGGTVWYLYGASELAATEAYTIGAGGVGGTATAGGNSTFKGLTAGGGGASGTVGSGATAAFAGSGLGGTASGGNVLNAAGGKGELGVRCAHGNASAALGGVGGGTLLLAQDHTGVVVTGAGGVPGVVGKFPGGGATGACTGPGTSVQSGAAGANGCLILKEYF